MPQLWESYIAEEENNLTAYFYAAVNDGHGPEDAEECENGKLKCSTCPWEKIKFRGNKNGIYS
jgi:hypothetical protein